MARRSGAACSDTCICQKNMLPRFEALASEGLGQFAHAELAQGLVERAHLDESLEWPLQVWLTVSAAAGESPGSPGRAPWRARRFPSKEYEVEVQVGGNYVFFKKRQFCLTCRSHAL